MLVEIWLIEKIKPYEQNARVIPERAVDKVAASLREFGWRQPIVVEPDGTIIVGHTRWKAAKKLGMTEAPVHVAHGLTPEQVKAYRLMDNRSGEETSWERTLLSTELASLEVSKFDLSLTGFERSELKSLLRGKGLADEDVAPAVAAKSGSKRGDCWKLGAHRLMCGDATVAADVERLMGAARADLVFTDPPYNVDYQGYTEKKLKIAGDKLTAEKFYAFLVASFTNMAGAVLPGASVYICHPSSWQREFQNALEAAGFELRTQIIWAKNTFAWGFGRYKFQHEPMFYGKAGGVSPYDPEHEPIYYAHKTGKRDPWFGDRSQSTLWQQNKPVASREHPTMKPVELVQRALVNSSVQDAVVLDLFGGAGSTLIACEKLVRRCYMLELDPRYCDVIVRRWEEYSGLKAAKEGDLPVSAPQMRGKNGKSKG